MNKRREQYHAYLKSREWAEFRAHIIKQRGRKCEKCGETKGAIHAHHLTYARIFVELESDIQLLCKACHDTIHNKKKAKKKPPVKKKNKPKIKAKDKQKINYDRLSPKEKTLQQRRDKLRKEGKLK